MTSSRTVARIPPWAMPSQPWKRASYVSSVHERLRSTCSSRRMPVSLSVPHAKQWCGAISSLGMPGRSMTLGSNVKVLHLASLGLDEVLPRADLLAHQHREDLVG